MSARNCLAVFLLFVIFFCVFAVNNPITPEEREAIRAYEARKKIEGQLDVIHELAKMEASSRPVMRQAPIQAQYQQPSASLPPSVLSR